MLILLGLEKFYAAAGWTLGVAVCVGVLRSIEVSVRRTLVPGNESAKASLAKHYFVRMIAVAVVISVTVILVGKSAEFIFAFFVGLLLTQAVFFLKVLGMLICQYSNE